MRIGRGCERCRHRHIRCTVRAGASACNSCARLNRPCHLDPRFRFKTVRHVYHKSHGTPSRFELSWDPEQVWVDVSRPLTFVQEPADESPEWSAPEAPESPEKEKEEPPRPDSNAFVPVTTMPSADMAFPALDSSRLALTPPMVPDAPAVMSTAISPPSLNSLASPLASSNSWTAVSPWDSLSPGSNTSSKLTSREAYLMRSFISTIAPWADICDMHSHFANEVPRRALQVPMVMKSLLALSARHDAIMSGSSDLESSEYHGQCLELLIAALARAEASYDDNMLITVVILRVYEELENSTDEKYHLLGSNRLLNTMSKSAYSGGLAEAVSWQFLRQAIYASVVQCQPLSLDLNNYKLSGVFHRRDDAAYANIIIFHCARVIQLCGTDFVDEASWYGVSNSVEQWYRAKPISWQPLRYRNADADGNRPFPEVWMMSPPAVVGSQYYHAACIFLTSSDGRWRTLDDYELARARRLCEKTIGSHLSMVIGLAMSNETVSNACFMVCHLLHRYGYCLRHPAEQRGSLRFLAYVEKNIGWRTAWMVEKLEDQWRELQTLDLI